MLFQVVASITVLGLFVWLIGHYFRYTGVAVIGAALVMIAGSAVALTGIDVKTGETRTFQYTEVNNSTVRDSATISYDYETTALSAILNVGVAGSLGMGGILMLLGAILMSQTLAGEVT